MIRESVTRREQKRLRKTADFKHVQRLQQRLRELREIEEQGREKVELPEPVFLGWERYFVVREDLRKSPEGPYLERLLALVQFVEHCDQKGVVKERDYRRGGVLRERPHRLKTVDPSTYWAMTEKMKRYFEPHVVRYRNYYSQKTEVQTSFALFEDWKFVTKVRERWKTHEIVYRVNVDEEEKLIHEHLYGPRAWEYRHWLRHVGDSYRQYDDYETPHSDLRRTPIIEYIGT